MSFQHLKLCEKLVHERHTDRWRSCATKNFLLVLTSPPPSLCLQHSERGRGRSDASCSKGEEIRRRRGRR
eukprot:745891-Hanusia_phi.AAC.1